MSDNGGEFINTEFDNFLKTNGIECRLTAPYCPEQSGIAESKNRSLVETACCLLSKAKLPLNMWAEAVNTANYMRNRCPTKALSGKTSYELFNEIVPNVSYFKTCGCTAYCLDNKPSHKFSARSKKGILFGYSENSKAFRIYLPDEKRFIISRNIKFFENGNINSSIDIGELFIRNKNLSDSQMEQEIAEIHTQNDVTEENHNKSSVDVTQESNIYSSCNFYVSNLMLYVRVHHE
ncbi:Copia protein [Araneus ventricosus]|uniref:Copia protein n=1 Tax=Araneus ventricosus TaxID=182803 RepID=A0A4Y2NZD3_ARAVE|nr:Copia protein [Araneus ventricosus]